MVIEKCTNYSCSLFAKDTRSGCSVKDFNRFTCPLSTGGSLEDLRKLCCNFRPDNPPSYWPGICLVEQHEHHPVPCKVRQIADLAECCKLKFSTKESINYFEDRLFVVF